MIILTLRTDKPEAEIGVFDDAQNLTYVTWQAHRELAETIHLKIKDILGTQNVVIQNIEGINVYKGPGSFTGLRIGIAVANALAESLNIPIVSEDKDRWIEQGIKRLLKGDDEQVVQPEYGALPHITQQKK